MRLPLVLLLTLIVAAPSRGQDGGADVPFADPKAGVFQVATAAQPDGGQLGEGWWVSSPRMNKVGVRLTELENENTRLKVDAEQIFRPTIGFWIGLATGLGVGVAGTVVLVNQIRR